MVKDQTSASSDRSSASVAESILEKAASTLAGCVMVERYEGGADGLIDSGWFSLTDEEAEYLDRLWAHCNR